MPDRMTWLGHATVLVEIGGVRLLTDPVLRRRVAHLRRHAPAVTRPRDVDAVLLSHAHRDHLDLPTLRALEPRPPLIVAPRGVGRTLRRLTGAEVREVEPGEATAVGAVRVEAVPAVHQVRRSPLGAASGAVGFVAEHEGRRVYFAGDTEVFPEMASLRPLDAALLPIWGWGPSLGPGHMDPGAAAEAVALLQPRLAVPIHWGTLLPVGAERRHGHLLRDPVDAFVRAAARRRPQTRIAVLAAGEGVAL